MTVLFIAPLPPPTHGQSLAAELFYRKLRERHEVRVVNMAKPVARGLRDRIARIPKVLGFLARIVGNQRGADAIYLTISESRLGNIKDLFIYAVCYRRLGRMFIHLLGGAGMKRIVERRGLRSRLNSFFISRLAGVIVEGRAQAGIFSALIAADRIHIVHNFAEDFLFVTEDDIGRKFSDVRTLKLLFLSNLLHGKGHDELVDAYVSLDPAMRDRISIVFVGGFESGKQRSDFLQRIHGHGGLAYRGEFIGGTEKKALFGLTHVFCLPTYYPYEGQPISILEAYATGCVVLTTNHSGIPEIFRDGVNGFAVEPQSPASIRRVLEKMLNQSQGLARIAAANCTLAREKYRAEAYQSSLMEIVNGSAA